MMKEHIVDDTGEKRIKEIEAHKELVNIDPQSISLIDIAKRLAIIENLLGLREE